MKIIALTGGIGSGKSLAAKRLCEHGAKALDLDEVAASLLVPGSPVLAEVVRTFGREVLGADGTLDRPGLARIAFASPESTRLLDEIVHPAVVEKAACLVASTRASSDAPVALVIEIPLLAEVPDFAEIADVVLAVNAPDALRIARAMRRGRLSEEDVRRRLAVQAPDEARAALADAVIVNDGSLEYFLGEVDRFWDEYVADGEEA